MGLPPTLPPSPSCQNPHGPRSPLRVLRHLVWIGIFGIFPACGADSSPEGREGETLSGGEGFERSDRFPPAEVAPTVVALLPVAGSSPGGAGEAVLWVSDDVWVILLEATGLEVDQLHPAHIHIGSCADGGPVAVVLNPVLGLGDASGSSMTTLEPGELRAGDPHFVLLQSEGGVPVACGDLGMMDRDSA